jgi:predicted nuclease of predicted toxin-antitoxin system
LAIEGLSARLLLDEDVTPRLAAHLREDGFDAYHVDELHRSGLTDGEQLAFAAAAGRVLVTHNRDDFLLLASEWWIGDRHHAGVIYAQQQPLAALDRRLRALLNRFTAESLRDLVLPLEAAGDEAG